MPTNIVVRFDLEGTHSWPDAPEEYRLLQVRHAHIFHFEAHIPVDSSRQIEFLEARRELMRIVKCSYGNEPCDFRSMSCEELSASLVRSIHNRYKVWADRVAVYEDAFVGAEVVNDLEDNDG